MESDEVGDTVDVKYVRGFGTVNQSFHATTLVRMDADHMKSIRSESFV